MPNPTKDSRLNLRLRTADDELIRHAAAQLGQPVSDFLTSAAVDRAHAVLADQRDFPLDDATWDAFTKLVDQPPRPAPRLVELFARQQRITR